MHDLSIKYNNIIYQGKKENTRSTNRTIDRWDQSLEIPYAYFSFYVGYPENMPSTIVRVPSQPRPRSCLVQSLIVRIYSAGNLIISNILDLSHEVDCINSNLLID